MESCSKSRLSLADVLLGDVRQPAKAGHAEPGRFLALLAGLVRLLAADGDAEVRHLVTTRQIAGVRIAPDIAEDDFFRASPPAGRAIGQKWTESGKTRVANGRRSTRKVAPASFAATGMVWWI